MLEKAKDYEVQEDRDCWTKIALNASIEKLMQNTKLIIVTGYSRWWGEVEGHLQVTDIVSLTENILSV